VQIHHRKRAITQIHDRPTQRLIQRRIAMSKAIQPQLTRFRARQRLMHGVAQSDEYVFGGVVVVDVQVALAAQPEGPAGVFGEGVQHVVEEADAGINVDVLGGGFLEGVFVCARGPGDGGDGVELAAVDAEFDLDFGFFGIAVDCGGARSEGEGVCGCHGGWMRCGFSFVA